MNEREKMILIFLLSEEIKNRKLNLDIDEIHILLDKIIHSSFIIHKINIENCIIKNSTTEPLNFTHGYLNEISIFNNNIKLDNNTNEVFIDKI